MAELAHGFKIDEDKCEGHLACMRGCPTQAIRVVNGKARLISKLCIDCGHCLQVCPSKAIQATTQSFAEFDRFKYKVAVPGPVLFGQFPLELSPAHIVAGLRRLGFDAVWDFSVELALVNRAVLDYVQNWKGPYPLISIFCPVIVRLIQVLYPGMVDQLVRCQPPRELAGRELKRKFSQKLGIAPDDIAAVYITPCQAKTFSILKPAEETKSNLDGALGISDIYNDIVALTHALDMEETQALAKDFVRSSEMLRWATSQGQLHALRGHRYMSVTGLSNVIQVFDDIEKGKLRNIEYIECDACWGGCVNGNLTVDNIYVSLTKIQRFLPELPDSDPEIEAEVERRYQSEDLSLEGRIRPRAIEEGVSDLKERVKRIKAEEAVIRALPGLDCGLCGAPSCATFARDVASGHAQEDECVFFTDARMKRLREIYLHGRTRPTENEP